MHSKAWCFRVFNIVDRASGSSGPLRVRAQRRRTSQETPELVSPAQAPDTEQRRLRIEQREERREELIAELEHRRQVHYEDRLREQAARQAAILQGQQTGADEEAMSMQYRGDVLQSGDVKAPAHFMHVRNVLEAAPGGSYLYPDDFGGAGATPAQVAVRGTLDMRAGGRATKYLMTTVEKDMVEDAQLKNGVNANDDEQLQVQQHAIPDVAAENFQPFANCTLDQLENYFCRKAMESSTVDTLITGLKGNDFIPGAEDLPSWFDARCRDYRAMRGEVSLRSFYEMIAEMLPDYDCHSKKL